MNSHTEVYSHSLIDWEKVTWQWVGGGSFSSNLSDVKGPETHVRAVQKLGVLVLSWLENIVCICQTRGLPEGRNPLSSVLTSDLGQAPGESLANREQWERKDGARADLELGNKEIFPTLE